MMVTIETLMVTVLLAEETAATEEQLEHNNITSNLIKTFSFKRQQKTKRKILNLQELMEKMTMSS